MTVMTGIVAACVASTLSIIFIWLAEEPVERGKLQAFATALYLLLVASTFYFYHLERDYTETAYTLTTTEAAYDEKLLALKEEHAHDLAWQAIRIEREVTEKIEARRAAEDDTMRDNLFLKIFVLEDTIKTQRSEITSLEAALRDANALNERLAEDVAALEDLLAAAPAETDATDPFFETYGSCEELNAVYPDGVPLEHDAYLFTFDTDFDGVACGQNDTR